MKIPKRQTIIATTRGLSINIFQSLGINPSVHPIKTRRLAYIAGVVLVIILLVMALSTTWHNSSSLGEQLYWQAKDFENQNSFTEAGKLYRQALILLQAGNSQQLTQDCREGAERMEIFQITYPYNLEQVKVYLAENLPTASAEQINEWINSGEIEHYNWDGVDHYFGQAAQNLQFSHLVLLQGDSTLESAYSTLLLDFTKNFIEDKAVNFWQQYQKPVQYQGIQTLNVPREKLPASGVLQIWFPLPINSGAQSNVVVESVTPDTYVKQPPSIDQDIGLLYMEVPLEQLRGNLSIQIKFTFTHFQQRFTVDPANIGVYDKNSALYQEYTMSFGNTEISSEIRDLALKIIGNETNPYLSARKLYYYIVDNITYAYMPHLVMWPRTSQSESVYVQQYRRGDCGAQSLYFSAMCRSLGIPSRTTGGWQLFSGQFAGHFWAEFYLPNYGWVPVDTSIAQLGFYPKNATDLQRKAYVDYFFANQDSMRCVVQKDIDKPLIPLANGMVFLQIAVQQPAILCPTMISDIPAAINEYWLIDCRKISL